MPTAPRAAAAFGGTPRRAAVDAMSDSGEVGDPPPTTPPGTGPERDTAEEPREVLEAGCDPRLGPRAGAFTELGPLRPSDPAELEPPPLDPPALPALEPPPEVEDPADVRGTAWPCASAGTATERLTANDNASRGKRVMSNSRGPGEQTSARSGCNSTASAPAPAIGAFSGRLSRNAEGLSPALPSQADGTTMPFLACFLHSLPS